MLLPAKLAAISWYDRVRYSLRSCRGRPESDDVTHWTGTVRLASHRLRPGSIHGQRSDAHRLPFPCYRSGERAAHGPTIFAMNHLHLFDPAAAGAAIPRQVVVMAADKWADHWFVRLFLQAAQARSMYGAAKWTGPRCAPVSRCSMPAEPWLWRPRARAAAPALCSGASPASPTSRRVPMR